MFTRRPFETTRTVSSTEMWKWESKISFHIFLPQTNWEINSTDLRNGLSWKSLLGVKISYLHVLYPIHLSKYSTDPKYLWLHLSSCSSLLFSSSVCLGGFIIACMGDFLLIFIGHKSSKTSIWPKSFVYSLGNLLRTQPILLDWSPSPPGEFVVLRVVMSPK